MPAMLTQNEYVSATMEPGVAEKKRMHRRALIRLLVLAVLFNQLVVFEHLHAGSGHRESSFRPHCHAGHSSSGHHHHPPAIEEESLESETPHNTEAVFFDRIDGILSRENNCDGNSDNCLVRDEALSTATVVKATACTAFCFAHPPSGASGDCPLYLRHLMLRI